MQAKFTSEDAAEMYGNNLAPAKAGDAGLDLRICSINDEWIIGSGVHVAIPMGWVGLVMPRGGLGFKYGVELMNTVGVIDAGYRGEIMIKLTAKDEYHVGLREYADGRRSLCITHDTELRVLHEMHIGDRIAQMVVVPHFNYDFLDIVDSLDDTVRGNTGFSSSGLS